MKPISTSHEISGTFQQVIMKPLEHLYKNIPTSRDETSGTFIDPTIVAAILER